MPLRERNRTGGAPLAQSTNRDYRSARRSALGADGVLLGTRFLATNEAPFPDGYKRAIVESDGHDTLISEIPDIVNGQVWPGAYARVRRNAFMKEWIGREGELRRRWRDVLP